MPLTMTGVVTGTAQTGLTTPTYTLVADSAPTNNGRQSIVSTLGGTQTNVDVHSVSSPFTVSAFKPVKTAVAPVLVNGAVKNVTNNRYKIIARKGVKPLVGTAPLPAIFTLEFSVPGGADVADPEDLRACVSMLVGFLNLNSAAVGDLLVTGSL